MKKRIKVGGFLSLIFVGLGGVLAVPSLYPETALEAAGSMEIILEGTMTGADRGQYFLKPFQVPEGIARIDVDFDHSHRGDGTEIEIAMFDPNGFRGTSRFSKRSFFIEKYAATPSYYPGPIVPGTWKVSLALPSIREGTESSYTVKIRLTPSLAGGGAGPWREALRAGPAWFHGDFHAHTGHSDGFGCRNARGERVPCQVHQVVLAAANRNLDFLSITDHNTTSHHAEIAALQPSLADLLLIRGQEVTTFRGHANVFGTSEPIDFRLGFNGLGIADVVDQVDSVGALFSINHPGRQTGERCTGCGWDAPGTDFSRVHAMEVVNSRNVETPVAGAPFWHRKLNAGYRIPGIGGSDDHAAGTGRGQVGAPTTVVYARELSEAAILDGVRAGHVFIKTQGPEGPDVYLTARDARGRDYLMGDEVPVGSFRDEVTLHVEVRKGKGQMLELISQGEVAPFPGNARVDSDSFRTSFPVSTSGRDWYRVNLRDDDGITAMTNPIYLRLE